MIDVRLHDLREYACDPHRSVDDRPFGGGEGMVLKIEPIDKALQAVRCGWSGKKTRTILLSAQGQPFDQTAAARLAACDEASLICGRYEGVDERVAEHLADEELSIGNFVVTGGEWAAGILIDCVTRLLPGALGHEASSRRESFAPTRKGRVGILDYPHYTRPARYGDWEAPKVLSSGHHEEIRRWRRRAALKKTEKNRPDLLAEADLSEEERQGLRSFPDSAAGYPRQDE